MRKFRRTTKAAVLLIEHSQGGIHDFLNHFWRELGGLAGEGLGMRYCSFDHSCLFDDVSIFFAISIRNGHQHPPKTGAAIVVIGRKIRAAIKRLTVRREKRGQRPSALSADCLHGDLIAAVNVGALVAINLYCYEALVD